MVIVREGGLLQQSAVWEKSVLLNRVEHTFHIQIHHLGEHLLRVRVELLAPCRAGIGEEDVDTVGRLGHLGRESVQLLDAGAVRGDGDGLRAGPLVWQGVQGGDGFIAGLLLAGGDVYFGAASLKETLQRVSYITRHVSMEVLNAPRGSMQSQSPGTARHDGNLSLEGEDG